MTCEDERVCYATGNLLDRGLESLYFRRDKLRFLVAEAELARVICPAGVDLTVEGDEAGVLGAAVDGRDLVGQRTDSVRLVTICQVALSQRARLPESP